MTATTKSKIEIIELELPKPITQKAYEADQLVRKASNYFDNRRSRGAPRKSFINVPTTMFVGNSEADVNKTLIQFEGIIGPKVPGNKRLGFKKLYGDLLSHFQDMRCAGNTLPRGGNISKAMIMHGLGEILRNNGCTKLTDEMLTKNSIHRHALGKKMYRVFNHVIAGLERGS